MTRVSVAPVIPTMREVRKLVTILKQSEPKQIILFGSLARGRAHSDSDIDLCVLTEDTVLPAFRVKQELYRMLVAAHYDFPMDVEFHVYSQSDYRRRLSEGDVFVNEIAQGRVVYSRE